MRRCFATFFTASLVMLGCAGETAVATKRTTTLNEQIAYLYLATTSVAFSLPTGLYVPGQMVRGRFVPSGNVQGDGEFAGSGQPGWLELADGSFHPDQTARAPIAPFIRGRRDETGQFRPEGREITFAK